jgi:nitric oxide reductase subunit B
VDQHDPHAELAAEQRWLRTSTMKYQTQKIALAYILVALALFAIQVSAGLLIGWIYVQPNFLSEVLPFNVGRMVHTNALVVWLLTGFMGATYFLVPEEAEREIHSPKLAYLQLAILVIGTLGAVLTYVFNLFEGNPLLGKEGREFIEQPVWVKVGIVVAALIFLYNVTMTVLKGRKTAITNILLLGLWGLSLLFLFAFYNPGNLALDKQYWWYIVHLWVEGTWELVMAAILAFLMLKLTGVDREVVEKWLYVIVATALFSGILGTGHHYYWIGMPGYWQWIGSIFSSLEVIPFLGMMSFAFVMVWKGRRDHPNKAALLWSLGCATLAFFGAGVWGFMHTLHGVNYYTHGTHITAAHGHLAFFGAYVALNLAMFTYAMPLLKGRDPYNQVLNMASFWLMSGGMVFMTFTLTFAGAVQTHLQRVNGEAYMAVQDQLWVFFVMRFGSGLAVVLGALLFIYAVLAPRREVIAPGPAAVVRAG